MAQRLVQPAQAVQVGDHQAVAAGRLQLFAGAADKAAAIQEAGQGVLFGGGELGLRHDDAGGANTVLEPDSAPDAGIAAAHVRTRVAPTSTPGLA